MMPIFLPSRSAAESIGLSSGTPIRQGKFVTIEPNDFTGMPLLTAAIVDAISGLVARAPPLATTWRAALEPLVVSSVTSRFSWAKNPSSFGTA